ncbi:MAG: precorrin-8X methylmutase [Acidimicrobiales bacterium]
MLAERIDLSGLPPLSRAVVARVAHATADLDLARSMVLDEDSLEAGVTALRRGVAVIADVQMVKAGISRLPTACFLDRVGAGARPTRCAAAMRLAAAEHPRGAIFVVGCAPTALAELVALGAADRLDPALVVGMPVGFVGAAEAKAELRAGGLPAVSNVGEKGGSAAAAAVLNALGRAAMVGDRA